MPYGKKDYGNARLGGPPGLYDSPNVDRETNGGIVTRARVPAQATPPEPEALFSLAAGMGLNDSDNAMDAMGLELKPGQIKDNNPVEGDKRLESGIPFSKPITGFNM